MMYEAHEEMEAMKRRVEALEMEREQAFQDWKVLMRNYMDLTDDVRELKEANHGLFYRLKRFFWVL